MLFLPVKLHIKLQNHIYTYYTFFPIGIWFHLNALVHNGKANIRDHLPCAASTFYLRVKRKHILCPLKRVFLILSRIKDKNRQFASRFYHIVLRAQIHATDINGIPQKLFNVRFIGHQSHFILNPHSVLFMYHKTH